MRSVLSHFLVPLYMKIGEDELFTRSAAVAYSASLAFAPTIILMVSFLGLLRINIINYLVAETNRLMGYEVGDLVVRLADYSKTHVQFASVSGVVGITVLIFSGSLFFRQVEQTMAYIFKDFREPSTAAKRNYYRQARAAIRRRFLTVVVFVLGVTFVAVSLCVSFFLNSMLATYSPGIYGFVYEMFSFAVFSFLFFLLYICTPARVIKSTIILLGSVITAGLFLIGKELIALYIASAGLKSIYGAAGTVIVFLIWFYYSSVSVFIGAEVIAVIANPRRERLKNVPQ